jgi:uncharacterized membrane protein
MSYFTQERKQRIVDAIREAELNTSGEIRVHVDKRCRKDVLDRAVEVFHKLKMEQTRDRNGVLLYVAMESRKTAILGDEGVNAVVPPDFWNGIIDRAVKRFAKGEYAEGIAEAVTAVGEVLKQHFPYRDDDINELPDEISFGEDD